MGYWELKVENEPSDIRNISCIGDGAFDIDDNMETLPNDVVIDVTRTN